METYRSYVFDFDYTLVDSSRGIVTCFRHVLDRHGYADVTEMAIKRTIGKTLEQSFSILTGIADGETLAAYKREYVKEADTYMTANTVLFPETVEVLRALKAAGATLGIVSTKYRYRILDLLDQRGQTGLVDFIVGGEDVQSPEACSGRTAESDGLFRLPERRDTLYRRQRGGCRDGPSRGSGFRRCAAWDDDPGGAGSLSLCLYHG